MLRRFSHWCLGKTGNSLLRRFPECATGLSRVRLVASYLADGNPAARCKGAARLFRRRYERMDIVLLTSYGVN